MLGRRFAAALGVAACLIESSPLAQSGGCVATWAESRFDGGAFDHWVVVSNECAQPVTCSVWSDVNPVPQVVRLERRETVQVLTFRASPASVFVPQVVCAVR